MSALEQLEIEAGQPSLKSFGKMSTVEIAGKNSAVWFAQLLSVEDAEALVRRWNSFDPLVEALRELLATAPSSLIMGDEGPAFRMAKEKAEAALKLAEEGLSK